MERRTIGGGGGQIICFHRQRCHQRHPCCPSSPWQNLPAQQAWLPPHQLQLAAARAPRRCAQHQRLLLLQQRRLQRREGESVVSPCHPRERRRKGLLFSYSNPLPILDSPLHSRSPVPPSLAPLSQPPPTKKKRNSTPSAKTHHCYHYHWGPRHQKRPHPSSQPHNRCFQSQYRNP